MSEDKKADELLTAIQEYALGRATEAQKSQVESALYGPNAETVAAQIRAFRRGVTG